VRTIHLHGRLGKQFGKSHRFAVATAGEAMRALNCAFPGEFVKALQTGSFKVVRGDKRSGMHLTEIETINGFNLGAADLHIIPVAKGAGNGKGIAKTILGVALIGGAIFLSGGTLAAPLSLGSVTVPGMSWGNIAALGLGITLAGASSLLSAPSDASTDEKQSYNLNGPSNTGNQGDPIPLIYGRTIAASVNVSFDADIEDMNAYSGLSSLFDAFSKFLPSGGYAQ
ncbi:tail assembly protein, partial [Bradyrhizobium sp. Leo170]|uniref:tail assembly protein n=1 Tax=Bradyrhizobium sp. Leo170 TaxID=1571199 RepID=UPI0010F3C2B0